jgi:hypothetical protein
MLPVSKQTKKSTNKKSAADRIEYKWETVDT